MGSSGHENLLEDLKISIERSCLVFPWRETERKSMFLSNIDQALTFDVQTLHFFQARDDDDPDDVAKKVEESLGKILVEYDYLGGRLKMNDKTGRFEIDCDASGAGFVQASSQYCLDEIGDLTFPNPAFAQLVSPSTDFKPSPHHSPLCIFQVTSFKCGGFAIGITTNHVTFDGFSFKLFLRNLAAVAADKPLLLSPCNDRRLLAARSPPRVEFPHPELFKPTTTTPTPSVFQPINKDAAVVDIFRLSSADINRLKEKARPPNEEKYSDGAKNITSFKVVTAFLWRCKALSSEDAAPEKESTILYAVEIRRTLKPPLPESYSGNAVLSAYARGSCKELEEWGFWKIVERVAEGEKRMTAEYARSAIDWGEVYKGFPHGDVLVSSWWKLGFDEVEYPWGKPKYSCPVVSSQLNKDIIVLFPDLVNNNDDDGGVGGRGINVLVALPAMEMDKFRTFFRTFLFG